MFRISVTVTLCLLLTSPGCNRDKRGPGAQTKLVNKPVARDSRPTLRTDQTGPNFGDPSRQPDPQRISDYIRRIFQDSRGRLWFGTNGDGVCRYDGRSLEYFRVEDGFGGYCVRGILEDQHGHLWFGTERGLSRYDGASFTNFTHEDGLAHSDVWCLVRDSRDQLWIGTLGGVSRYDGSTFEPFDLPEAEPDPTRGVTSSRIVHSIIEDRRGRMWFGTNGGAYILDGESLTNLSEKDGLCHNSVNHIFEATDGAIWFATHHNGVCRYDGKTFRHFGPDDGVLGTEAWNIYEDRAGNIWFTIEHAGVYRHDGTSITRIHREQGLLCQAVQSLCEDREGRFWLGGVFGLFRYEDGKVFAVGKAGPWE